MTEDPYRWLEAIANRREYIRTQLKGGSPVLAASVPEGVLLLGIGTGQSKVFEIFAAGFPLGDAEYTVLDGIIAKANAAGDTRIIGDRFGRPWMVGVRNPDDGGKVALRLPLEDAAISTSGDYERYFEEDGVRYHHILDPKTGLSTPFTEAGTRNESIVFSRHGVIA